MSALTVTFDTTGMTPEQVDALELEATTQSVDSMDHPDARFTVERANTPNKETVMGFGLTNWEVHDRYGERKWSGKANGPIHALDQYVMRLDAGYVSYTEIMDDPENTFVYEHEGLVHAILENTEIIAIPADNKLPVSA